MRDTTRRDPELRQWLRQGQPNCFLPLDRSGVDPFVERWPVTLRCEGTVRGVGGIRLAGEDCATDVPGLYAAGDAASRERSDRRDQRRRRAQFVLGRRLGQLGRPGRRDFARQAGGRAIGARRSSPLGRAGLRPSARRATGRLCTRKRI